MVSPPENVIFNLVCDGVEVNGMNCAGPYSYMAMEPLLTRV